MANDFVRNIKNVRNINKVSPNIITENDLISTVDNDVYVATNDGYKKITGNEIFKFEDLTPEQKEELKGEGLNFEDLTPEQKEELKGEKGIQGSSEKIIARNVISSGVNKPLITFVDDDGRTQVKDKWEPITKEKKNKLTIATVTSWVENKEPTVIQWEEIHEWNKKYGVEFVSHTHEHKHAQQLTEEEVEKELKLSHDILKREGLTHNIIVQPFGENTDAVRKISRKYYRGNVGTKEDINTTPLDTFNVRRISLGEDLYTTFEQYKEKIDEAIANNGWIIFKSHSQYESFNENQLQIIRQIIDYAREQQMLEVNLEEGFNYMGNLIDTGDYFKKAQGSDYFVMDKNGKIYSNFGEKNYDNLKYNSVNINTPVTDFKDRMTSTVAIIGSNSEGFPNNTSGQLITTKSESIGLSYQIYLPNKTNVIYKRRWDHNSNKWTPFEAITSTTKNVSTRQYANNTQMEPQTTKDVIITNSVLDGLNFDVGDTIVATTEKTLPSGIMYNVFINEKNKICIRYANITNTEITIEANYFNFRITYK